jgi:YgiT-type zinc finger domain-containing protein
MMMRCVVCRSEAVESGHAAYVVERDDLVAVIRRVPADICSQCGEEYFAAETAQAAYDQAEHLLAGGGEVAITTFAA